jgi:aminoglycoside 6'-N-acetyltransferase I
MHAGVAAALDAYRATGLHTLDHERKVGRAGLPSTVLGLLFHAAEHARRHAGQVIATATILKGSDREARSGSGEGPATWMRQTGGLVIRSAGPADRDAVARMRSKLWPDSKAAEIPGLLERPADEGILLVAEHEARAPCGYAEIGTRPFAEGCSTSPVAYLEGIWVEEAARRQGVARALVRVAEDWGRGLGLQEIASDTEVGNVESQAFHRGVGFEEAGQVVCFRRMMVDSGTPA